MIENIEFAYVSDRTLSASAESDTIDRSMGRSEKRLEDMRNNPSGDWTIEDIRLVCNAHNIDLEEPTGGSHWGIFYRGVGIQTIPFRRKIKTRYIKEFVKFVDRVKDLQR